MPSRLDDVLDALVAVFAARAELDGVTVHDGPTMTNDLADDLVLVGHDGTEDSDAEPAIEQSWVDLACTRRQEVGVVPCAVISQGGDTDLAARRTRAFELLAACEAALLADMTLAGVVMSAQLTSGAARQVQDAQGAEVTVPFVVAYRAHI